ncbi:Aste57867_20936 [Aphanomyces stellatus]|uniref:Aste57867_20936 protein n=1 Tax=Aphanomyces stellatus TaxID=120398 RepID=A0A485LG68_9STRA|nr:hypothetical protein As57867_020868 [Aphanomyces stellatus]VFT97613.1 Aste57867_20936 [Aphanomyces stellatus]
MDDSGDELDLPPMSDDCVEENESGSQKRTLEEWDMEQEARKRAKSALDHAEYSKSFPSLASAMASLEEDDDADTPQRVAPLASRPKARKGIDAVPAPAGIGSFTFYRDDGANASLNDTLAETEEVQFESQLVDMDMSETQEETQTMVYKRIKIHPHVAANLSPQYRKRLEKKNLLEFEIGPMCPSVTLTRQAFVVALRGTIEEKTHQVSNLSKDHCAFELVEEAGGRHQVYIVDKNSRNGTKVDGETIPKGGRVRLHHNQTITLLSTAAGTVIMGYIVEDPHVLAARQHVAPARQAAIHPPPATVELEDNVLGVLFAAPLVGKDKLGNCHPLEELDLAKEYANLKDALVDASKRARTKASDPTVTEVPREVTLSVQFATADSLRSLMTLGCRAFHYSGHGSPQHLYFEDGLGTVHPIPIADLRKICVSTSTNSLLRLVVVQACYSHNVAMAFLGLGIPHVIAIKFDQKIEDLAAAAFTKAFYMALATGKTVQDSFVIGRGAVGANPHLAQAAQAANKFELLPEGADHSEVIFPTLDVQTDRLGSIVKNPNRFPVLWGNTSLPAVCTHFCHRTVEQYHVIHELAKEQPSVSRYVWISGPEGIGKTQLAYAACRYMHPRAYFAGGIRCIPVHQRVPKGASLPLMMDSIQRTLTALCFEIDSFAKATGSGASQVAEQKRILVILDECDALLSTDVGQKEFSNMVHSMLTSHHALKLIVTARQQVVSDRLQTHGGSPFVLGPLNPHMSADLLRRHIKRKLSLAEVQLSPLANVVQHPNPVDNLTRVLAAHPLVVRTQGVPKAIMGLASLVNSSPATLDQLVNANATLL